MKRALITSGLLLGLSLTALALPPRSSVPAALDADKKEVACAVCGKKVDKDKARKVEANGKEYLVCSEACAKELEQHPDKYAEGGSKKP